MKKSIAISLLPIFTSCASLPELPPEDAVNMSDIVSNIRCELETAANASGFSRSATVWNAGISLELKVNQTSSGVLDSALTVPLHPGVMRAGLKVGQNSDATRAAKFKFAQPLKTPPGIRSYCEFVSYNYNEGNRRLLGGRLGFAEWMVRLRNTMEETKVTPTQVGYSLQFVIKPNIDVGPKFTLLPIGDANAEIGLNLTAAKSTFHTLEIVLDPVVEKKPTDVRIVADIRQRPGDGKRKLTPDASRLNDLLDQQSIKSKLDQLILEDQ
jgi:hypothetical protein